ncbi:hypothetical protein [Vibrio splendidus]|uniref:hypothetical protein n=1 Tax=Vibrio splendidus TaxID=29497 RepID=UPI00080ECEB9|nr:hypothetical protein [Vibrio splendidus]OCH67877.1 hypothetical protein A6D94_06630 [Vibrio splendidus]
MSENKSELEQATELHQEAMEFLKKARQLHDSTLSHQRKLAFALSSILPKNVGTIGHADLPPEVLANKSRQLVDAIANRDLMDVINTIMNMAISNKSQVKISVDYASSVDCVCVRASSLKQENDDLTVNENIFLQSDNALAELLAIEDKLIDLIADAHEVSETIDEVEV